MDGWFIVKRLRAKEIYCCVPCPIVPARIAILKNMDSGFFADGERLENGKIIFVPTENLNH